MLYLKRRSGRAPDAHDAPATGPCCCFFVGLRFAAGGGERRDSGGGGRLVDLRPAAGSFVGLANSWDGKAELCPSARMLVRLTKREELPAELLGGAGALPFDDDCDRVAICGGSSS